MSFHREGKPNEPLLNLLGKDALFESLFPMMRMCWGLDLRLYFLVCVRSFVVGRTGFG